VDGGLFVMSKILIVDDAQLMRNMIKNNILEHGNHIIYEAKNGEEAVKLYKEKKPDLVTMDITMEIKDGVAAAKDIINHDSNANVIMITALGQEKLLRECVKAGIKDYIVKPFSKERLHSAVTKALE
jgi:two-component system chemotaxis response regulator CheY